MFKLKLQDRNGIELNEGDIVKISNRHGFTFFAEVKYLEKEGIIAPFHTFSFHSFVKVDKVPDNAIKSTEERYGIWYVPDDVAEVDEDNESFNQYLISWRQCEHLLESCFKIEIDKIINPPKAKTIQQLEIEDWADRNCDCNGTTISDADPGL